MTLPNNYLISGTHLFKPVTHWCANFKRPLQKQYKICYLNLIARRKSISNKPVVCFLQRRRENLSLLSTEVTIAGAICRMNSETGNKWVHTSATNQLRLLERSTSVRFCQKFNQWFCPIIESEARDARLYALNQLYYILTISIILNYHGMYTKLECCL